MKLKSSISLVLLGALFFLGIEGQIFEGKSVRKSRQRHYSKSISKRPLSTPVTEAYVYHDTRRPTYTIEGGNDWKPMYNVPTRSSSPKYRPKPTIYSSKYQQTNYIHPSEHQPKNSYPHPKSTVSFVANRTVLVSDPTKPIYKEKKYHYVSKNNYQQQYEVHEDTQDDSPTYSTQSQYHYQTIPVVKGKNSVAIKPSSQYTEVIRPEKHIHHVHYHDTIEEAVKTSAVKNYKRNHRRNPTSLRPY